MPKNPVCGNCGNPLTELFSKEGFKVYVCPQVEADAIRTLTPQIKYPEIWCKKQEQQPQKPKTYSQEPQAQAYAKQESLKKSFLELSKDSSLTIQKLQKATLGTVSKSKLYESANTALMLGLDPETLPDLFNAATKLGAAMGITTEKAVWSLTRGLGRKSKKILDNIGVLFNQKEASEWYKIETGIQKLNEEQKGEAWIKYAVKLIIAKAKPLTLTPAQVEMQRKKAQTEDHAVEYGRRLLT